MELVADQAGEGPVDVSGDVALAVAVAGRATAGIVVRAGGLARSTCGRTPFGSRELPGKRESRPGRRIVANRVRQPGVETAAGGLGARDGARRILGGLRPQGAGRENAGIERAAALNDGDVVVGRAEEAHLERAPAAAQAEESVAAGEDAAGGAHVDRAVLDLENRIEAATERLGATNAEARRVRVDPEDGRVRVARCCAELPAVNERHIHVRATVQRDVCGLRLRQRGSQQARNGDSD